MTDASSNDTNITPEQESELREELKKTEADIATLRQALSTKLRHADELKKKLKIGIVENLTSNISEGIHAIKESTAYTKTVEVIGTAKERTSSVVSEKFTEIKNSETYKTVSDKVGTAYSSVKESIMGKSEPAKGDTFEEALQADRNSS